MRIRIIAAVVAACAAMSGCGDKPSEQPRTDAPEQPQSVAPPVPDVGRLETVEVQVTGLGQSPGEAMAQALQMALLQVNGAVIQSASVTAKYGLDVALGQDAASLRASAFAEVVKQKSGGVIQSVQVVDLEEPKPWAKRYKYTIKASISKFKPSAEMQKIKVVVGPVRFEQASLPMGDRSVAAAELSATLRQRISDALVQTGRFAVLDREFSPEIEQELAIIATGQAPSAELAKLSQAASADLVWSARVSSFAYNRHARQLKTSDRQLVSYSGGWALSQKLVNVATRQVTASDSLRGSVPSTAPTTLGAGVDGNKVMTDMSDALVAGVVSSILQRTFPLTVVARDGESVVLSQGGQAVKEGARYQVVAMGKEMKDPQTGQSLGRLESPCCELVVDRVTPNLSYGHLENMRGGMEDLPPGGLQVREVLKASAAPVLAAQAASGDTAAAGEPHAAPARAAQLPAARRAASPAKEADAPVGKKDDDNW
ncbi:CsgG/HfaB family protein [Delftia acidovorans]|uniref:CsgG/HfaB family protein n=1 Tax=Delftia acidovorans TaxID=80866 RepID=UPI00192AEC12|nr:CsgG/HfaB family protein [Delftia acidovorans]